MNRISLFTVLLSVAMLAGLSTQARAQAPAVRVAIANPAKIFADMQETKDLRTKLDDERKRLEATEREKRQRLADLQSQRELLNPGTPDYEAKNRELITASIEFESWGRLAQLDVQRNQKMQMIRLFGKIQEAVGEVARNRGYDLVISQQAPELPQNIDQIDVNQLRLLISQRTVLFNVPSVDISDEVTALLDQRYRNP